MADESVKVPIDGDTSGFDQKVEGMKGTISAASVAMGNLLSDMGKKALSAFGDMISSGDEFNRCDWGRTGRTSGCSQGCVRQ